MPFQHFDHPHLLDLHELQEGEKIQCSGCELPGGSDSMYGCNSCNYFLHEKCLNLKRWMEHPAHPEHPLTFLPKPTYPNGSFRCNACGDDGSAFSYCCAFCEFDLHTHCASLPRTVVHEGHSHPLTLTFKLSGAETTIFTCDVCNGNADLQYWVYNCDDCNFGTHLGCVAHAQEPPPSNGSSNELEQLQQSMNQMMETQLEMARLQNEITKTQLIAASMRWAYR
ncbi:PREDICTED: uncharacterized protein LOC104597562 [Nelumbo nucifera]|uniref:DC1 domain-containing protein n=2 Tax=Nelumbo nucifera TaxID=4432 RepID=A0A822Z733_NELNU|nr:PREDICTED: uncharacterized protein LOC104597562 [Nelumbo nucifera]DAD42194.1 TPA_asm: hypothetical protein HUJ06_000424 [Nelumbo nucifera]